MLVKALIDNAFSFGGMNSIQSYILEEINVSVKVLSKCAFRKIEDIEDKDTRTFWKWELIRTD